MQQASVSSQAKSSHPGICLRSATGLLGFLAGFFISGAAMISNDYFDLAVDRVNQPQRPLPSGRISVPEVMFLIALFSVAGFVAAGL